MKEIHRKILQMREQESTYEEICQETGLSKSSVSYVITKYFPRSRNQTIAAKNDRAYKQSDSFKEAQNVRHAAARERYRSEHASLKALYLEKLRSFPDQYLVYYVAGLYAGEGSHHGTEFSFCNSDPALILAFLRLLREVLGFPEDRFTLRLALHKSMPTQECSSYWEEVCGRPMDAINQHDARSQQKVHKHHKNRRYYGTLHIRVREPNGLKSALRKYSY